MENPIKMDDLGGKNTIFGNTQIGWYVTLVFQSYRNWGLMFDRYAFGVQIPTYKVFGSLGLCDIKPLK